MFGDQFRSLEGRNDQGKEEEVREARRREEGGGRKRGEAERKVNVIPPTLSTL